jgi:transposase-like protein
VERMEPAPAEAGEIVAQADEERALSCPWCDSEDVEKVSEYGPHLMVYQYICRECNSPFEVIKR